MEFSLRAERRKFQRLPEVGGIRMPCKMDGKSFCKNGERRWAFWSRRPNDELDYQCTNIPLMAAADDPVVPSTPISKERVIYTLYNYFWSTRVSLVQFWAPVKVNGSIFLSVADQPFVFYSNLDKGLCSYRRLCLNSLIPLDVGPVGRVCTSKVPEFNPDLRSYSNEEFPMVEQAIQSGIRCCWVWPWSKCAGVFELSSIDPAYYPPLPLTVLEGTGRIELKKLEVGLHMVRNIHSLPFAQIWDPNTLYSSIKTLVTCGRRSFDSSSSMYEEFASASRVCRTQWGKAVVGRALLSQESCFCKDVTLLNLTEYPLVPSSRKAKLTRCFAICLRSKCADSFVRVVECFLPPNKMVDGDAKAFLNRLLSTMKEQLPGFIVASGKELGQRMQVVEVSAHNELDSFEIGLPSVESLQHGGATTETDSLCQWSNLLNVANHFTAERLVPSCSSHMLDSFNFQYPVQVDKLVQHPTEEAVKNRRMVNVDVGHIQVEEDTREMMQLDSHFELSNLETDSGGNARRNDKVENGDIVRCGQQFVGAEDTDEENDFLGEAETNIQKNDSQKNEIQRIVEDYGITLEVLKGQFGKTLKDAAKDLKVSRSTLKRIRKAYGITRWPHHKTIKANPHVNQGVSSQGAESYVGDRGCQNLSQEKAKDCLPHKRPPATGKPCDSAMTAKVTYGDDTIKFKLTASSTWVELQGEVERRFNISLKKYSIKYQDEDDDWIMISTDSDLRDGMDELRSLKRTTMRLLLTPKS